MTYAEIMKARKDAQAEVLGYWLDVITEKRPMIVTMDDVRLDVVEFQRLREKARLSAND